MRLGKPERDRGGMTETTSYRQLRRSRTDRVFGGVCGGFARYLGIDPVAARVIYVLATFLSGGALIVGYLLFWLIMPEDQTEAWPSSPYPPTGAPTA
jgi:phage shock protein C